MSRTTSICCLDCKKHLWIGQSDHIYTGEKYIEALNKFLQEHKTTTTREFSDGKDWQYHELLFMYEPFNGSFEDIDWEEIENE